MTSEVYDHPSDHPLSLLFSFHQSHMKIPPVQYRVYRVFQALRFGLGLNFSCDKNLGIHVQVINLNIHVPPLVYKQVSLYMRFWYVSYMRKCLL